MHQVVPLRYDLKHGLTFDSDTPKHVASTKTPKADAMPAQPSSKGKAEDEIKKLKAELAREKRKAQDEPAKEEYPLLKSQASK